MNKNYKIDRELRALYEEKGKIPNMKRLDYNKKNASAKILIVFSSFLILLIAVSWLGFFLFGSKDGSGSEISLSIDAPGLVTSGKTYDAIIRYKNVDRNPLAMASLVIRKPDNIVVALATPPSQNEGALEWNFGTLEAKQSGQISLKIIPYGFIDDELELRSLFNFKPSNFNAEFQTSANHAFKINDSPLSIKIDGPANTTPGQEFTLKAQIENKSDQIFEKIKITPVLPEGFSIKQEPALEIAEMQPNAAAEILIVGMFTTASEGEKTITLNAETTIGDKTYPISKQSHAINVQNSDLGIQLLINESPDQSSVRIGQDLNINLKLTNRKKEAIKDTSATLKINSDIIDWNTAQSNEGVITDGLIAFPKNGDFTLLPDETKELKLAINLKNKGQRSISPFIEIQGEVKYDTTVITIPLTKVIVVSDLSVSSYARYFDANGNVIGSGPLPPKAGQETIYKIKLNIRNTFHDLSNIVVTATLPENGRWVEPNNAQGGKISFNQTTREIRWEIPRMPITTTDISANFSIGVTPSESDQGQLALLLGITRAEALDTIAQTAFSVDSPSISSNLDNDSLAKGKGVVE